MRELRDAGRRWTSYWDKLSAGGDRAQCGWLKDKYGLSWQIIPTALAS